MATSRLGLSQPTGTDLLSQGDNIISADNVILDKSALITSGLFSARPSAATVGALNYYLATDTSQLFISTGAAFVEVAPGAGTMPIGSMSPWTGSADPTDTRWVIADGRALSTTTYATLYNTPGFGNTYDTKDSQSAPGAGLFRIPKLGGVAVIGAGSNTGLTTRTLGQRLGEEVHALTTAELAAHAHTESAAGSHAHGGATVGAPVVDPGSYVVPYTGGVTYSTVWGGSPNSFAVPLSTIASWNASALVHAHGISTDGSHTHTLNNTGSGTAHNVIQPSMALNYIIRIT